MRTKVFDVCLLWGRVVWTSSRAMKPKAPALCASSASIASASRSSLSVALWREIVAFETQRTAVLRASKAVSWARRGFEVGTKRATNSPPALPPSLLERPGFVAYAPGMVVGRSRGLIWIHAASSASVSGCHKIVAGSWIDPLIALPT